jgi:tetratricopeptide (TPR) repeat protein
MREHRPPGDRESGPPSPGYNTPKGADEQLAEAVTLQERGQWLDAAKVYTTIEHTHMRCFVLVKRAMCFGELGIKGQAMQDLQMATDEFPLDSRPPFFTALLKIQWGLEDEALVSLGQAIERAKGHKEARELRARIIEGKGMLKDAEMEYDSAIGVRQDVPRLWIERARLRMRLGAYSEAAVDFGSAIRFQVNASKVKAAAFDYDQQVGRQMLEKACGDDVLQDAGDCYLGPSKTDAESLKLLMDDLLELDPARSMAMAQKGRAYAAMGKHSEARSCLDGAVAMSHEENAAVLVARAHFCRINDPESAISDCQKAIDLNGGDGVGDGGDGAVVAVAANATAYLTLGKIQEQLRQSRLALAAYEQAVAAFACGDGSAARRKSESYLEASMRMCDLKFKTAGGDTEAKNGALRHLKRVAKENRTRIAPWLLLAKLHEANSTYSEAIRCVTRAIGQVPHDASLYALRSKLFMAVRDKEASLRDWWSALNLQGEHTSGICKQVSMVQLSLNMLDIAEAYLVEKQREFPEDGAFWALMAKLHYQRGDFELALQCLDEAVERDGQLPSLVAARGTLKMNMGEYDAAGAEFEQAVKQEEANAGFLYGRAYCRWKSGQFGAALADVQAVVAKDPHHVHARLLRARLLERERRFRGALHDYFVAESTLAEIGSRALRSDDVVGEGFELGGGPGSLGGGGGGVGGSQGGGLSGISTEEGLWVEVLMKRGILHSRMRNFGAAIGDYDQAMKRSGPSVTALLHRGIALHASGCTESAIKDYDALLAMSPGHATAMGNKGRIMMDARRWREALDCFTKIPSGSRTLDTDLAEAACYARLHERENAKKCTLKALEVDQHHPVALVTLADILEEEEPLGKAALKALTRTVAVLPGALLPRLKLSFALARRGLVADAAKQLQVVSALDPGNGFAAEIGSMLLVDRGNGLGASLKIGMILQGKDGKGGGGASKAAAASAAVEGAMGAALLGSRGVLQAREGDMEAAISDLSEAERLEPESADVKYNLGCLHLQMGRWLQAKIALNACLSKGGAANPLALMNRGVANFHLERFRESLSDFDAALEHSPNLGEAMLNKAAVLHALGRGAETLEVLDRAAQLLAKPEMAYHSKFAVNAASAVPHQALIDFSTAIHLEGFDAWEEQEAHDADSSGEADSGEDREPQPSTFASRRRMSSSVLTLVDDDPHPHPQSHPHPQPQEP